MTEFYQTKMIKVEKSQTRHKSKLTSAMVLSNKKLTEVTILNYFRTKFSFFIVNRGS
jgi:hypothetical protein